MTKVSVIIPVYNGEKYLRQCLDSVCMQSLKEIEIICVDDGSTDSSLQILQEYKEKDERVQVYHQENKYAGAARNLGKEHATGEYLVFWDCDDFFETDALEKMYLQAAKVQADVCVCGANKYYDDTQKVAYSASGYLNMKRVPGEVFNRETNPDYIMNFTSAVPWNKMYRREYVENLHLDFQTIRNGNDIYFTQCAIVLAERITTVNEGLVYYRLNQADSLFGTLSKSPLIPFGAWISVAEKLTELGVFPEKSFVNKVIDSTIFLLRNNKEAESFAQTVEFLKSEGLQALHIEERDSDFYYTKWHYEFVNHLLNDTLDDFRAYLSYQTYLQLTERSAEKTQFKEQTKKLKQEVKQLKKADKEQQNQIKELKSEISKVNEMLEKKEKLLLEKEKELKQLEKDLNKIKNSWSFKIGKIIVWLPGKLKRIFK